MRRPLVERLLPWPAKIQRVNHGRVKCTTVSKRSLATVYGEVIRRGGCPGGTDPLVFPSVLMFYRSGPPPAPASHPRYYYCPRINFPGVSVNLDEHAKISPRRPLPPPLHTPLGSPSLVQPRPPPLYPPTAGYTYLNREFWSSGVQRPTLPQDVRGNADTTCLRFPLDLDYTLATLNPCPSLHFFFWLDSSHGYDPLVRLWILICRNRRDK